MRRIFLIFVTFLFYITSFAQFVQEPCYEFSSTSSHKYIEYKHQYTIPVSEIQQPFYSPQQTVMYMNEGPGYNPADPGWENVPIGDPPYILILLTFIYYVYKKKQK